MGDNSNGRGEGRGGHTPSADHAAEQNRTAQDDVPSKMMTLAPYIETDSSARECVPGDIHESAEHRITSTNQHAINTDTKTPVAHARVWAGRKLRKT